MLAEERRQIIQDMVNERESVTLNEVIGFLNISESTARRDLTELDRMGRICKVHGGAVSVSAGNRKGDQSMNLRKEQNSAEKRAIAAYAASLLEPGDFVYLDAGTTTELVIDHLEEKRLSFVTNAAGHARRLSQLGYTTYILGGEFKGITEAVVGDEAVDSLMKYNFTKGFWGTNGADEEHGYTTPDVREAMVKRVSISRCKNPYILCDASKFLQVSSVKFADFANAVMVTTLLEPEIKGRYEQYVNSRQILEVRI